MWSKMVESSARCPVGSGDDLRGKRNPEPCALSIDSSMRAHGTEHRIRSGPQAADEAGATYRRVLSAATLRLDDGDGLQVLEVSQGSNVLHVLMV
jgi:hypothetical protein